MNILLAAFAEQPSIIYMYNVKQRTLLPFFVFKVGNQWGCFRKRRNNPSYRRGCCSLSLMYRSRNVLSTGHSNYCLASETERQCTYSLTDFHSNALYYERAHCVFSTVHTAAYVQGFSDEQAWHNTRSPSSQEHTTKPLLSEKWLTTTVRVRGLCRSILQAVQDLSFAHIAVSHQEELEQVVVAFHWAALAAHGASRLSPGAEDEWL